MIRLRRGCWGKAARKRPWEVLPGALIRLNIILGIGIEAEHWIGDQVMRKFIIAAAALIVTTQAPAQTTVYYPNPAYYSPGYSQAPGLQQPGAYQSNLNNPAFGQPSLTVPGTNPPTVVGPSNSPVGQIGQSNTSQTVTAPSASAAPARPQGSTSSGQGSAAGSKVAPTPAQLQTGQAKNVRGMIIEGTATVIDGDTFYVGDKMVFLFGADAPERDQKCFSRGVSWMCGERAKEELARLIEGRFVSCVGQKQAGDAIAAVCKVPGGDVGSMLVGSGYAVVPWEVSKAYVPEQEMARGAGRGIWSGVFDWPWNYRAKRPDVVVAR